MQDLTWGELDFNKRIWTLPAARAKNGVEHQIPLSDAVIAALQSVPKFDGCPHVFTVGGNKPINDPGGVKRSIDELAPDIPAWTFHDIRRTFASGCARLGIGLPTVERILNHVGGSFSGVAGVYQRHDFLPEARRAMETWSAHIERLMSGQSGDIVPMVVRHG